MSSNLWCTLLLVNGVLKRVYMRNPKENRVFVSGFQDTEHRFICELLDRFWLNSWLWMCRQVFFLKQPGESAGCPGGFWGPRWKAPLSESKVPSARSRKAASVRTRSCRGQSENQAARDVCRIIQKGFFCLTEKAPNHTLCPTKPTKFFLSGEASSVNNPRTVCIWLWRASQFDINYVDDLHLDK